MTYLKCITILCFFFFCLYIVNTERILVLCRVSFFRSGPATDGIQVQQTRYNEFVESGSKSWALMRQRLVWERTMIKQELRTQNQTALHPREKGLLVRGCELPAPLASHEPFFLLSFLLLFWEISVAIYPSPPFILHLHIHAYSRMHVPSATLFGAL